MMRDFTAWRYMWNFGGQNPEMFLCACHLRSTIDVLLKPKKLIVPCRRKDSFCALKGLQIMRVSLRFVRKQNYNQFQYNGCWPFYFHFDFIQTKYIEF